MTVNDQQWAFRRRYEKINRTIVASFAMNAQAAILVVSPDGTSQTKPTLESARTSLDAVGKRVVVTSPLTASQSNIIGNWPGNRLLEVQRGGSINTTLPFKCNIGSVSEVQPEWFGAVEDGSTDDTVALSADGKPSARAFCPSQCQRRLGRVYLERWGQVPQR